MKPKSRKYKKCRECGKPKPLDEHRNCFECGYLSFGKIKREPLPKSHQHDYSVVNTLKGNRLSCSECGKFEPLPKSRLMWACPINRWEKGVNPTDYMSEKKTSFMCIGGYCYEENCKPIRVRITEVKE